MSEGCDVIFLSLEEEEKTKNGDHGDDHYNHDCDGDGLSEILDFNLNLYIF